MKTKPIAITAVILIGVGLMFICTSFIGGSNLRWLAYALEQGINDGKDFEFDRENFDWEDSEFDEDDEDWYWQKEFDTKFKRNSKRKTDYDYSGQDIKALHIKANGAKIYLCRANDLNVSVVNGINRSMYAELSDGGTLRINEKQRRHKVRRWRDAYRSYVIIGMPNNTQLNEFTIELNGAALQAKDIDINALQTDIEVNASAVQFVRTVNFKSFATDISCNAANVQLTGELKGKTDVSCNTGGVQLNIIGDENEYSWTSQAALGVIRINGSTAAGGISAVKSNKNEKKYNHLDISCNVGSVDVSIR